MKCSVDPPEGHPGRQAYTFVIRILLKSLTSVSISSVCCCSRYVFLWSEQCLGEAAFGTSFIVTGSYQKSGTSFRKRVTGMILKMSRNSSKQAGTLWNFFTRRQPIILEIIVAYSKSIVLIFKIFKLLIHLVTRSLKGCPYKFSEEDILCRKKSFCKHEK
jgi:hypothetical protein